MKNSKLQNVQGCTFLNDGIRAASAINAQRIISDIDVGIDSAQWFPYILRQVMTVLRRHNSRCRFVSIHSLGKCSRIRVRLIGFRVFCSVRYMNNFFVPIGAVTKRHRQSLLLLLPTGSDFRFFRDMGRK